MSRSKTLFISDFTAEALEKLVVERGGKPFNARQILRWFYKKGVGSVEDMTDLPLSLRERLGQEVLPYRLSVKEVKESKLDTTRKFLFATPEGHLVESVLIESDKRRTVCLSTQIGCAFRCKFCASGARGLVRDLSPGEIVEQVVLIQRTFGRITNVVFMGSGEPFGNYEAVIHAARMLNSPGGLSLGARRITISTAGHVPGIERFCDEPQQFSLAVSLHTADEELRSQLMPINRKWGLKALRRALQKVVRSPYHHLMFEYIIIGGINDSRADAQMLADYIGKLPCWVNLIRYNPVDNAPAEYRTPIEAKVQAFRQFLVEHGLPTIIRESRGADIQGACGQLVAMASSGNKEN